MWARTFQDRLASWVDLRSTANQASIPDALAQINTWWFQTPWQPYHLHWDDHAEWPDPWQLLDDNIFCEVARGLGICYTLAMLDRHDLPDFEFIGTKNTNLVLVDNEKYILNYTSDDIVNTNLECEKIQYRLTKSDIQQQLK